MGQLPSTRISCPPHGSAALSPRRRKRGTGPIGPSSLKKIGGQRNAGREGFEPPQPKAADLQSGLNSRRRSHEFPRNSNHLFREKRPFPRRVSCPFCSAWSREADPLLVLRGHKCSAVTSWNTRSVSGDGATAATSRSVCRQRSITRKASPRSPLAARARISRRYPDSRSGSSSTS